jgi:hemin uptake protein HemP
MNMPPLPPSNTVVVSTVRVANSPDAVTTEQLFGQSREIVIRHQGEDYRLRITKNDKLILTK